ncbi:hypothetical protein [Variovorax sp. UMC13]|uniref:hypothetical protein n=1 Tax=Variovorax sp. UMC13 TaxID=1862326 RepID=UPI001602DBA7|nr:hypothetical protein [Variovorax sp. UMC13]MBB1600128.1 hypothetical protein [Variovorax sp. UMC13]
MKASPGARSWIAAGVRHELLIRALPALRHDMTGPVSVMRMGLLMLRRQVAAPAIDPVVCEQRVTLIDSQIAELVNAVRSLRDWELAIDDEGITRHALVAQGVGLMRAAFELQGIHLQVDGALQAPIDGAPKWPSSAALRYLFLGALGYLHDTPTDVGTVTVSADGDDALWLRVTAGEADGADAMAGAHRAPRMLAIDAIALQSLADDLGYALAIERDAVRLTLAAA